MSLLEIMAIKLSVQINNNDNKEAPMKTLQIAYKCIKSGPVFNFFFSRC